MQDLNGNIWLIQPTTNGALTQMFFAKFNDVTNMQWIAAVKCTEIHTSDPSSIYTDYAISSYGGDGVNMFLQILLNGGTFTTYVPTYILMNGNTMQRVGTT
jgi:hypothetical protein